MSNLLTENEFRQDVCLVNSKDFEIILNGFTKQADVYLLDRFTTPVATVTFPRTCEPLGTLSGVDTGSKLSIGGGELLGSRQASNDPRIFGSFVASDRQGEAIYIRAKASASRAFRGGWSRISTSTYPAFGLNLHANMIIIDTPISGGSVEIQVSDAIDRANYHEYLLVLRSVGLFYFIRISGAWTLLWVGSSGSFSDLFANFGAGTTDGNFAVSALSNMRLYSDFATDYGIATTHIAAPTTSATGTMTPDGFVNFTWTPVAGETLELDIRRTNDDNRWIIRCNQAGSTIKLIERSAGVETERASAAQTWTVGTTYTVQVRAVENNIRTFVNSVAKNIYASASFNNTATGVKVSGFTNGVNLATFPRTLSGRPKTILDSAIASLDHIV